MKSLINKTERLKKLDTKKKIPKILNKVWLRVIPPLDCSYLESTVLHGLQPTLQWLDKHFFSLQHHCR